MGTVHTTDTSLLIKAIELGVRQQIDAVFEEEIKAAQQRIEQRVRGEMDKLALRLLADYNIERMGANLIITVKKEL